MLVQKLGDKVVDFVFKTFVSLSSHSHVSNAFSKRNAFYWIVRVLALADFGCRWLNQLWRVTDPRPDLENLCGNDTGGICVLIGEV